MKGHYIGKGIRNNFILAGTILLLYVCVKILAGESVMTDTFMWADAFSVTGVIFLCVSFLRKLWQFGYFDGISYMLYAMRYLVEHEKSSFLNFYDYKAVIEHGRRPVWITFGTGFALFIVGMVAVFAAY